LSANFLPIILVLLFCKEIFDSINNFRNINHSFTLKITEEQEHNDNINLNSQKISVSDEFKKADLRE
jgi:hypothetical protein